MRRVMHSFTFFLAAGATALVLAPVPAHAEGYISPFAGVNFGTNTTIDHRGDYGVDLGWMGGGIAGFEADFGISPSYFGNSDIIGTNNVWDLMGNFIVGAPAGGTHGLGIRPYATIGFGLLRTHIEPLNSTVSIDNNDPGLNAGVGVMGFLGDHVGLRGDVRYFRDVHASTTTNSLNIDFGGFHYWRASIGVVLR
jgi:hypothetical protein